MALSPEALPEQIRQVTAEETTWQCLIDKRQPPSTHWFGKLAIGQDKRPVYFQRQIDRTLRPDDLQDWQALFAGVKTITLTRNQALAMRRDDIAWSLRGVIAANLALLWQGGFFYDAADASDPLIGGIDMPIQSHPDHYCRIIVPSDGSVSVTIENPTYTSPKLGKLAEHTYELPRSMPYVRHLEEAVDGQVSEKTIYFDTSVSHAVLNATQAAVKQMATDQPATA